MSRELEHAHVVSSMPKPWEQEETFHDTLYEWMGRAPWLAISAALHLVIFLIVQAIPWNLFQQAREIPLEASVDQAPEQTFEDPPPEVEREIEEEETEEEPIFQDFEVSDHEETDTDELFESTEGDPDMFSDAPFDDKQLNDVIGIGGSSGGPLGQRGEGRRKLRAAGGRGMEQALEEGLAWLVSHQDAEGGWDCDGFMRHDPPGDLCTGPGDPLHDVGVTGLALLAFLGEGSTLTRGPNKDVVARGVKWLREQQDYDSGLIGEEIGHTFLYDHAIASLAMCEAYYFSKSPWIRGSAQDAVSYILKARNPYGAWRYDVPPIGENDTSVTGWMVFALKSAEEADLKVEQEAFAGALSWIDEVTDPATGRVGYDAPGNASSRIPGVNDSFPPEKGEAMTAVGLLCRIFLGQDPKSTPIVQKHAELMLKTLPKWEEGGNDMYYWYYGSYAMFQMGGAYWDKWNEAMKSAVLGSQRHDGTHKGSWDPVGPWGKQGGRVYATATMVLCLEVYFRYARVLGGR